MRCETLQQDWLRCNALYVYSKHESTIVQHTTRLHPPTTPLHPARPSQKPTGREIPYALTSKIEFSQGSQRTPPQNSACRGGSGMLHIPPQQKRPPKTQKLCWPWTMISTPPNSFSVNYGVTTTATLLLPLLSLLKCPPSHSASSSHPLYQLQCVPALAGRPARDSKARFSLLLLLDAVAADHAVGAAAARHCAAGLGGSGRGLGGGLGGRLGRGLRAFVSNVCEQRSEFVGVTVCGAGWAPTRAWGRGGAEWARRGSQRGGGGV